MDRRKTGYVRDQGTGGGKIRRTAERGNARLMKIQDISEIKQRTKKKETDGRKRKYTDDGNTGHIRDKATDEEKIRRTAEMKYTDDGNTGHIRDKATDKEKIRRTAERRNARLMKIQDISVIMQRTKKK